MPYTGILPVHIKVTIVIIIIIKIKTINALNNLSDLDLKSGSNGTQMVLSYYNDSTSLSYIFRELGLGFGNDQTLRKTLTYNLESGGLYSIINVALLRVWPGNTVFPDFTHPDAVNYWYTHAKSFHDKVQYDGMWIVSIYYINCFEVFI